MKSIFLLLSCLVLVALSAAAISFTDESSDTTNEGMVKTLIMKRNAAQFGAMIWCKVKRNPLDYNGYGCHCGIGGKGEPVDDIDRCCYVHDDCYNNIVKKKICPFREAVLTTVYFRKGCTRCVDRSPLGNSRCQKTLCECDAAAARCFKKNDSKFRNRYKNYPQSSC